MRGGNLSEWALRHQSFVWYLMLITLLMGAWSYFNLGREEDPAFTIKTMVIQVSWPGATIDETLLQVTDRIEKKLEELDALDYVKSYTRPGESTIFVYLKATTPPELVEPTWYQVRKKVADLRAVFPEGVLAAQFDDEFGDVYGSVYAFTADGLSMRQLQDYVEEVRTDIRSVPHMGKTELIGVQEEVVYLDISTRKLAALGLDYQQVLDSLQTQNAVTSSGVLEAGLERVTIRTSGRFTSEADLEAVNLRIDGRFHRLADIASIHRGVADPPAPLFRYNGEPAIGLAIALRKGGNILEFGEALRARMDQLNAQLPIGIGVHVVADQAKVVEKAVGRFTGALFEAVLIVMLISVLSLGLRAGLVVVCAIPLTLALVFIFMEYSGITMQRISLGALIIALGLLVDDAMITVEMMVARLEAGDSLYQAAIYAYRSTAFPMLTGTLVTVAGFVPIGLNDSMAGEYTFTLFAVIAIALLLSWLVAVVFTPVLGVHFLRAGATSKKSHQGWLSIRFEHLVDWAMRHRRWSIGLTLGAFMLSVGGIGLVQLQFFPASDRPELLVDLNLPHSSSIEATRAEMDRFEMLLKDDPDVLHWSSYVGRGAVRFYLSLDQQLDNSFYGQLVIVSHDIAARDRLAETLRQRLREDFIGVSSFIQPLELGPPVGQPIQYRLSGKDPQRVRQYALELGAVLGEHPGLAGIVYDWNEPGKVLRIEVAQDRARQLGLSSEYVAQILNAVVSGAQVTQLPDGIHLVNVVGRSEDAERGSLETLENLQIVTPSGTSIPLLAFANLRYELEQPLVWRRDRKPTITLKTSPLNQRQPTELLAELAPKVEAFAERLPANYQVAVGGAWEESTRALQPIVKVVPLMLFLMMTILMIQLHSLRKLFLVLSVAPLGLIGVVLILLTTSTPLGFVAILGVLALIGIIIRNAVILVTQIEMYEREGRTSWQAVAEATRSRSRPILLTAAAASLGMIPIAREVFWGPMALAMIGGIASATVLTLLFLPALYVSVYRLSED